MSKPMTNYNEILDEILSDLREDAISYGEGLHYGSVKSDDEIKIASESLLAIQTEAKQAITSLIKELVAEAKPTVASKEVIETYLQNGMTQKAAECHGRNQAIDQFEQNLLKALEEV